ncbi:MAG TPA: hypothetical protein VFO94_01630 [Gammaproteobacteria bacterium]|nr:hypothetical protein [Gammaproteobacteria bacterium]
MPPIRIAPLGAAAALCALGLLSTASLGQEPAAAPAAPPASTAPADSKPAPAQPASQSTPGTPPSVTPPAGAPVTPRTPSKDDEFIPTEELGADEEVTFPVDI